MSPAAWIWANSVPQKLDKGWNRDERCTICLSPLCESEAHLIRPVQTACGHWFHELCVRRYTLPFVFIYTPRHLRSKNVSSCPLCRCENVLPPRKIHTDRLSSTVKAVHDGSAFTHGSKYALILAVYSDQAAPLLSSAVILSTWTTL